MSDSSWCEDTEPTNQFITTQVVSDAQGYEASRGINRRVSSFKLDLTRRVKSSFKSCETRETLKLSRSIFPNKNNIKENNRRKSSLLHHMTSPCPLITDRPTLWLIGGSDAKGVSRHKQHEKVCKFLPLCMCVLNSCKNKVRIKKRNNNNTTLKFKLTIMHVAVAF